MSSFNSKDFFNRAELILVRPDATLQETESICRYAAENDYRGVCVNSSRVGAAFAVLEDTNVKVISTIGFPFGVADSDVKRFEAEVAIDHGAQELELVFNLGQIRDGEEGKLLRELRDIVDTAEERPVSILFGTKLLSRDEQILVCNLAVEAGAKFVNPGNADIQTIQSLREMLSAKFGIKATGEIRDLAHVEELIAAGATHFATQIAPQFGNRPK